MLVKICMVYFQRNKALGIKERFMGYVRITFEIITSLLQQPTSFAAFFRITKRPYFRPYMEQKMIKCYLVFREGG